MARVSRRDLQRLARNSAAKIEEQNQRGHSLAVCFDALVTVLDRHVGSRVGVDLEFETNIISTALKAELDKRRAPKAPA